jgi:hypothetical protein
MEERRERERVEAAGYKLIASLYTGTKKLRERQVDHILIVKG